MKTRFPNKRHLIMPRKVRHNETEVKFNRIPWQLSFDFGEVNNENRKRKQGQIYTRKTLHEFGL